MHVQLVSEFFFYDAVRVTENVASNGRVIGVNHE
jgi:hypothetical protein